MRSETVHHETLRGPLGARVAFVDRRSLSQAWYSALHVAERGTAAGSRPSAPASGSARPQRMLAAAPARTPLRASAVTAAPRSVRAGGSTVIAPAPAGRHARKITEPIARAVARPRPPHAGTGMTIALGDARVHVLVRRASGGVRVIALCARRHEAAVRGALVLAAAAGAPFECCNVVSIGGAP